jgi:hypothetical protein
MACSSLQRALNRRVEVPTMPITNNFSTIVQEVFDIFGALFDNKSIRRHFAESLTGWMLAENTTASGINRERVATTAHVSLSR